MGCLLLLSHLACGDRPLDATRGGGGGSTGDARPACAGDPKQDCINGCATGHVLSTRVCQDGAWVCPLGTNPTADCAGTGDCPVGGGGPCTDGATGVIYYKQCANGAWLCPAGTRPVDSAVDAGAPDAGPDGHAPATCAGNPFSCAIGTPGGMCGDATWSAQCTNGVWACAAGMFPFSQCRCSGPTPPGCICGDAGLTCSSDAGAD